jgi:hypothetical protein
MINKYENCKIVNIVWIERGILITIIYYILKKYIILLNKIIIINNKKYCKFFKIIFPELKFSIFKKHIDDNFYFNIRKIIKNQDIIIDYLANYYDVINTNKIKLLPWYDMNDPIIVYQYNSKFKIKIKKYKIFINNFSKCHRANYYNKLWDAFIEYSVLNKYVKFNKKLNIYEFLNLINNFLKSTYTNTVEKSKIYYIDRKILYPVPYNSNQQINPNISYNTQNNIIPQRLNQEQINKINLDTTKPVAVLTKPTLTKIGSIEPELIETETLDDSPFKPIDIDMFNFASDSKCEDLRDLMKERKLYISILCRELKFNLGKYGFNIKEYIHQKIEALNTYIYVLLELMKQNEDPKIKDRIKRYKFEREIMDELYKNFTSDQELIELIKNY